MKLPKLLICFFMTTLWGCSHGLGVRDGVRLQRPSSLKQQAFLYQRQAMHTLWNFTLVADREPDALRAFDQATAEIDRLDNQLAMWKKDSLVAAVNRSAGIAPVKVDGDLAVTLELALKAAAASRGAFDPTIGPLTEAWYYSLQKGRLVPASEVKRLLKLVDWRKVKLAHAGKDTTVFLPDRGMMLDLGGIAKGYAQDSAAAIFKAAGIASFLMNAGGQVYASGSREDGQPWKVGIENPRDERRVMAVVPARNSCLATSGDYEQFTLVHGRRYHHILDPRTGSPTRGACISATALVPADEPYAAALADAFGTAAFVLGPARGKSLLEENGYSGILVGEGKKNILHVALTDDLVGKIEITP